MLSFVQLIFTCTLTVQLILSTQSPTKTSLLKMQSQPQSFWERANCRNKHCRWAGVFNNWSNDFFCQCKSNYIQIVTPETKIPDSCNHYFWFEDTRFKYTFGIDKDAKECLKEFNKDVFVYLLMKKQTKIIHYDWMLSYLEWKHHKDHDLVVDHDYLDNWISNNYTRKWNFFSKIFDPKNHHYVLKTVYCHNKKIARDPIEHHKHRHMRIQTITKAKQKNDQMKHDQIISNVINNNTMLSYFNKAFCYLKHYLRLCCYD